jgi:hypothetical protein
MRNIELRGITQACCDIADEGNGTMLCFPTYQESYFYYEKAFNLMGILINSQLMVRAHGTTMETDSVVLFLPIRAP